MQRKTDIISAPILSHMTTGS